MKNLEGWCGLPECLHVFGEPASNMPLSMSTVGGPRHDLCSRVFGWCQTCLECVIEGCAD